LKNKNGRQNFRSVAHRWVDKFQKRILFVARGKYELRITNYELEKSLLSKCLSLIRNMICL